MTVGGWPHAGKVRIGNDHLLTYWSALRMRRATQSGIGLGRDCDYGVTVTGGVEVGVGFPQPGEFQAFAQPAEQDC
jgi:hypothetical protein